MTANVDAMVREGIRAYRAVKSEARALLEKAVELDQYNEEGWLWLSAVVESPEEQRTCLENVIFINPSNANAKQGLQMLTGKTSTGELKASPSATGLRDDPGDLDFSPPAAPVQPQTSAFSSEIPSSVEWETPPTATSSPSSTYKPPEPSASEYDSWVAGLGLSGKPAPGPGGTNLNSAANVPEDIFPSGFFDDEEEEEDEFAPIARRVATDDAFTDSDFGGGPFGGDDIELPDMSSTASVKPKTQTGKLSPGAENLSGKGKSSPAAEAASGALFGYEYDSTSLDDPDPAEYFQLIPKDIPATRLPGTKERANPLLLVGLVVLVMLNVGAAAMLVTNLAK